jgi:hypothetical protein
VGGYNLGYYGGNWMDGILAADQWALVTSSSCRNCPYPHLQSQQFTPRDPIATDDAPTAYVKVLAGGGATLPARDSADVRTVNGVLTDTGRIIDCVTSDPYPHSTGIAQAGTSNTITLAVTCSANDGWFNGEWVEITGGTGQGQTRTITGYAGATKVAAVDVNWTVIPDSTSAYQLIHPCTKNAGGWPVIAIGNPRADADGDGMADEWEAMYSLSSSNASDRNLDPDNDGYTNLEEYLNNSDPKISDIVP